MWLPRFARCRPLSTSPAFDASLAARLYWKGLYDAHRDAFTLPDVSPTLLRHWPLLSGAPAPGPAAPAAAPPPPPRRILAPLCGRDISLTWLASQPGWQVVGVDFADSALRQLGAEVGGLLPVGAQQGSEGAFRVENYPALLLLHADFMALPAAALAAGFGAAWDRGGLTSMAAGAERAAYAARLAGALAPGGRLLLELLATNVDMDGALRDAAEGRACLEGAGLRVEVLEERDVRGEYPQFRPPGLKRLTEVVLLAERPAGAAPRAP